MKRFHINPATGDPRPCTAKVQCRFGSPDEHYDSMSEALVAYEVSKSAETKVQDLMSKVSEFGLDPLDEEEFDGLRYNERAQAFVKNFDKLDTQSPEALRSHAEAYAASADPYDSAVGLFALDQLDRRF